LYIGSTHSDLIKMLFKDVQFVTSVRLQRARISATTQPPMRREVVVRFRLRLSGIWSRTAALRRVQVGDFRGDSLPAVIEELGGDGETGSEVVV
jgi:hypothetical protein